MLFSLANISNKKFSEFLTWLDDDIPDLNTILNCAVFSAKNRESIRIAYDGMDDFKKQLHHSHINVCSCFDKAYPQSLNELLYPPKILYYFGDIRLLQEFSISIIGSRKPTQYGIQCAYHFGKESAVHRIPTVSGLAMGIDGIAQSATVEHGGKTVAVLGSNLLEIYPKSNQSLATKIVSSGGLILTEYHHGNPTLPHQFVERNQMIAALCDALLVVEAAAKSGTMTTVDFALDIGRNIYAICGNIFSPNSSGTNRLIQSGAKLTMDLQDILEDYDLKPSAPIQRDVSSLSELEIQVLEAFEKNAQLHVEQIAGMTGRGIPEILGILNVLEIKSYVISTGNQLFCRI